MIKIKYHPLKDFNFKVSKKEKKIETDFYKHKLSSIKKKYPINNLIYLKNWNTRGYYAKSTNSIFLFALKVMALFNFGLISKLESLKLGTKINIPLFSQSKKNLIAKITIYFTKMIINKNFSNELRNLLGENYKVDMVLFHSTSSINSREVYSKSKDAGVRVDHITDFHYDTTPPNCVKIMIYLSTNVSIENGAFRYIPGSYKLNLKKSDWYASKVIRENYWETDYKTLLRFYTLKKNQQKRNGFTYLLEDDAYKSKLDNAAVVFESPLNMILFNPLGIHTGGFCYNGKRKALQVTLTKCN